MIRRFGGGNRRVRSDRRRPEGAGGRYGPSGVPRGVAAGGTLPLGRTLGRVSDHPTPPRWDEPEQAPPWRGPADGQPPAYRHYELQDRPTLLALVDGQWHTMHVHTRIDYVDGRVAYKGDIRLPVPSGPPQSFTRTYWWPQDQLRVGEGTDQPPQ
jgi:hypothetical protein